ncbi:hypothetical protein SF23_20795 [Streptomyces sp. MBRL 10]|nr:hypothetical protein SF23_20795 [Streptomyces sp. MBRL 10]
MRRHELVVIGAGSGNAVVADSFADLDVAIVEERWFGGTCLNAGCIPSKMFAHTAHVARAVEDAGTYDVDAEPGGIRWRDARDRIFRRLGAEREEGRRGREAQDFVTVYEGRARFTGPRTLRIERSGTAPLDIGVAQVVIAAELAEVFAAAGSAVTIVEKERRLLGPQDEAVSRRFTELVRSRHDLRLGRELTALGASPGALRLALDDGSTVDADTLLVAVGRIPDSDRLDLGAAGIATHDDGRVIVDAHQRTTAGSVYALGDICSPVPLKHVANREAKVVAHNLRHPDDPIACDHDLVPAAVFTAGDRRPHAHRSPYWIHPALTEVVENALLDLGPDP